MFLFFLTLLSHPPSIYTCENINKTGNIVAVSVPEQYFNQLSDLIFNSSFQVIFTFYDTADYIITIDSCPENFKKIKEFYPSIEDFEVPEKQKNPFYFFTLFIFTLFFSVLLLQILDKIAFTKTLPSGMTLKILKRNSDSIRSGFMNLPCVGDEMLMYNKLVVPIFNDRAFSVEWIDRCKKGVAKCPDFVVQGQLISDDNNKITPIKVTSHQLLGSFPTLEFTVQNKRVLIRPKSNVTPFGHNSFHLCFYMNVTSEIIRKLLSANDRNGIKTFANDYINLLDLTAFGLFVQYNNSFVTIELSCKDQELIPKIESYVKEIEVSKIGEINVICTNFGGYRYEATKLDFGGLLFTTLLIRKSSLYVLRSSERFSFQVAAVILPTFYLTYNGNFTENQIKRFDKICSQFDDIAFHAENTDIGTINGSSGFKLIGQFENSIRLRDKIDLLDNKKKPILSEMNLDLNVTKKIEFSSSDAFDLDEGDRAPSLSNISGSSKSNNTCFTPLPSNKANTDHFVTSSRLSRLSLLSNASNYSTSNSNITQFSHSVSSLANPPNSFSSSNLASSGNIPGSTNDSNSLNLKINAPNSPNNIRTVGPSTPQRVGSFPKKFVVLHRKRNTNQNYDVIKIKRRERGSEMEITSYFGTSRPESHELSLFYDQIAFYDKEYKLIHNNSVLSDIDIPDNNLLNVLEETSFKRHKKGLIKLVTKDKSEKTFIFSNFDANEDEFYGGCIVEVRNQDIGVYLNIDSPVIVLIADSLSGDTVWSMSENASDLSISSIAAMCHPNDRATFVESIEHIRNVLSIQLTIDVRIFNRRNVNDYEYFRVSTYRRNSRYFTLSLVSIHELKQRLEIFKELDDSISTAMRLAHISVWHFEDTNSPMRVYTSLPPQNIQLNMNWTTLKYNVLGENTSEDVIEVFKRALENKQSFSIEVPLFFNDFQWVSLRGVSNGIPGQLMGTATDITQTKNAEDAVKCEKERAEEANSAKMRFLANMSHEIRNPLSGMSGLLELLFKTELSAEQLSLLECAKTSFLRLLELLNDTLDLAKIEQGKMQMTNVSFSPLEIFSTPLSKVYKLAEKKNLPFICQTSPDLPLIVRGDPHFVTRIFSNLVSNAVKFTDTGYILIQVLKGEEETLIIKVNDTGIGICAENQEIIFEAFTQGDASIRRPYGGIGVGLTLIKKMVEMMKGSIKLESKVGEGSRFTVTIPLQFEYVPFVPRTLTEKHYELLLLYNRQYVINSLGPHCEFYGIKLIIDPNEVTENLLAVCLINEESQIKTAKEIKKKHELGNSQIYCSLAIFLSPHETLSNDDESSFDFIFMRPLMLPIMPKFFRNLIWGSLNKKKSNDNNSKNEDEKELKNRHIKNIYGNYGKFANKKGRSDLSGIRVIAADDNQANRLILSKIFQRNNAKYCIVENGAEVIEHLKSEEYDVVILDQHMPIMDGPTCAQEIRKSEFRYSRIPIIAMTGSVMKEDEELCIESGMNLFLTKPVSIKATVEAVLSLVDNRF